VPGPEQAIEPRTPQKRTLKAGEVTLLL